MSSLADLTELLTSPRDPHSPFALDKGRTVQWSEFLLRVRQWSQAASGVAGKQIALYTHSAYDFMAALCGIWQADKVALIPGDILPTTVDRISSEVDALFGDFPATSGKTLISGHTLKKIDTAGEFHDFNPLAVAVVIYTSGSTGEPKPIPIHFYQFAREVQLLQQQWGHLLNRSLVLGTVSHQHLYGLTFRLFWPICSGRPFIVECCRYLESLAQYAVHNSQTLLVTTPSHLSRLPDSLPWRDMAGKWSMVLSSTAPLALEDSENAHEKFACDIVEILGSSETGVIASRIQVNGAAWTLLPGLMAKAEPRSGAMSLLSPLTLSREWLQTADRIEMLNSRQFQLLGRIDRIAKIEGKRISLTAVEHNLESHDWVLKAKALVMQNKRTELVIVACLSATGLNYLQQMGARQMKQLLTAHLKPHLEAPALPRRWRFPDKMPENAQGKITQAALQALFRPDEAPGNRH